jgi:group I intron endonuclease
MTIYSIYKFVNKINGKVYIGSTNNFERRCKRHLNDSKTLNRPLYKAIRKYGWDNFVKEIIYQSKDYQHCIKNMENSFIKEYNSYIGFENSNGYNLTLGGEGFFGLKRTKQHKQNISKAHKGKKKTPEHIKKLNDAKSKTYVLKHPDGHIVTIQNMSEYCRINNLNQSHMIGVYLNRPGFNSHKGYTRSEVH